MVNGLTFDDQLVYFKQDPNPEEKERVTTWNQRLIENVKKHLRESYAQRLSERQLDLLMEPCIKAIQDN